MTGWLMGGMGEGAARQDNRPAARPRPIPRGGRCGDQSAGIAVDVGDKKKKDIVVAEEEPAESGQILSERSAAEAHARRVEAAVGAAVAEREHDAVVTADMHQGRRRIPFLAEHREAVAHTQAELIRVRRLQVIIEQEHLATGIGALASERRQGLRIVETRVEIEAIAAGSNRAGVIGRIELISDLLEG